MKRLMAIFCMPLVAGCLTASDPDVTFWPLEYQGRGSAAADAARYGVVRMLSVSVRPPYAERRLSVLRANGSIAFDPCHEFAASPSLLARSVVAEAMVASGLFKSVVGPSSAIASDVSAEVVISRLALDCRSERPHGRCGGDGAASSEWGAGVARRGPGRD